jgi:hypothetical protein
LEEAIGASYCLETYWQDAMQRVAAAVAWLRHLGGWGAVVAGVAKP